MSSTAFWHNVWSAKAARGESVRQLSGRSRYGDAEVGALLADARAALALDWNTWLLEIGCAAGLMGEHLSTGVGWYVGVDYNEGAVEAFKGRCPELDVRVANALGLPFADGLFDCTLMGSVLLCLSREEGKRALREMRRVTRPGGRGFIQNTPQGMPPDTSKCPEGCFCLGHAQWFAPGELQAIALECGWKSAEIRTVNPLIPESVFEVDLVVTA